MFISTKRWLNGEAHFLKQLRVQFRMNCKDWFNKCQCFEFELCFHRDTMYTQLNHAQVFMLKDHACGKRHCVDVCRSYCAFSRSVLTQVPHVRSLSPKPIKCAYSFLLFFCFPLPPPCRHCVLQLGYTLIRSGIKTYSMHSRLIVLWNVYTESSSFVTHGLPMLEQL